MTEPLNWRDHLKVHPAADVFPLLSETDPAALRELGEDIKKNGLRAPIALWKNQKRFPPVLLDGRNRLDAMEAASIEIKVESRGTDANPHIKLWYRRAGVDNVSRQRDVQKKVWRRPRRHLGARHAGLPGSG